mmetsp:Transcript_44362/g.61690  ORF Transcript_44362/g.61690 Transcript_44362/m.61690 type:complete len:309 (-) Transcript_44362:283-1209(-)
MDRKKIYFAKLLDLVEKHSKILLVSIDNVGSKQLQDLRRQLRGEATFLMGKNTLIRKALRTYAEDGNPQVFPLLDEINGNIGLVFTNNDLATLRTTLEADRVPAAAKPGTLAPGDVYLPAGPTGLEPTQTQFLQALNISTKIVKGQIDIQNPVHLLKKDEKVGSSEALLLQKLGILPFTYGINVVTVYDAGFVYPASLLKLTDADVLGKFALGVQRVAALGFGIGYPTIATVPHSLVKAFKNVLGVAIGIDYSFPEADLVREMLANPDAFANTGGGEAAAPDAAPAAAKEPTPEPSSEEEMDMGDIFG